MILGIIIIITPSDELHHFSGGYHQPGYFSWERWDESGMKVGLSFFRFAESIDDVRVSLTGAFYLGNGWVAGGCWDDY